jgi:hypothetical protein
MAVQFTDLNSEQGLKQLDDYLLTRSYITGYVPLHWLCCDSPPSLCLCLCLCLSLFFWTSCSSWLCVCVHCRYQASRDDLSVFAALRHPVPAEFVNVNRWHSHIAALVGPRCVILFAVVCSFLIISWLLLLSDALSPGKGEATYGEICRGAIEEEVAVGKLCCKGLVVMS